MYSDVEIAQQGAAGVSKIALNLKVIIASNFSFQREAGAPFLRRGGNQVAAQYTESAGVVHPRIGGFETGEGQVRALGRRAHQALPCFDGAGHVVLRQPDVTEVQVGRGILRIEIDRGFEPARGFPVFAPLQRGKADFVLEKGQDLLVARLLLRVVARGKLLPHRVGLGPLVLLLVQLLEVRHGVAFVGIEAEHF